MNTETKAAIERLRRWAKHELRPAVHDGGEVISVDIDADILSVCNAAEQRDDLLAKIEYARVEADTKRLDWLEKLDAGLWKGITREAIDAAMNEGE